jgi:hypothetical protein
MSLSFDLTVEHEDEMAALSDELKRTGQERLQELLREAWQANLNLKAQLVDERRKRSAVSRSRHGSMRLGSGVSATGVSVSSPERATVRSTSSSPRLLRSGSGTGPGGAPHTAWDQTTIIESDLDEPAGDYAVRISELEAENMRLEERVQDAERRAKAAKDAYQTMWGGTTPAERLQLLHRVITPKVPVPEKFAKYEGTELVAKLAESHEAQEAVIFHLRYTSRRSEQQVQELSAQRETLFEDLEIATATMTEQERQYEEKMERFDVLREKHEWLLQQHGELQDQLSTLTAKAESLSRSLKDRDKQHSDVRAQLEDTVTALDEAKRNIDEMHQSVRKSEADKEVLLRQLEVAAKKLADGERRIAEIAQSSLDDGADIRNVQVWRKQWGSIVRNTSTGPVAYPKQRPSPSVNSLSATHGTFAGSLSAASSSNTTLPKSAAPANLARGGTGHPAPATSPQPRPATHGGHTSVSPPPPNLAVLSGSSDTVPPPPAPLSENELSIKELSAPGSPSELTLMPSATTPEITPAARLGSTQHSEMSLPRGPSGNGPERPAPMQPQHFHEPPPGRAVRGAGPGRPSPPNSATLAALAAPQRVNPHLRDRSKLQRALMTRSERARADELAVTTKRMKSRTVPAPPPLNKIAL